MNTSFFHQLIDINRRPEPFEIITTEKLWRDPHTSAKMLAYHLDGSVDLASRRTEFLDRSAQWIISHFGLVEGKSVADFGCGPGLYTSRLAASGADITGIDFSKRSLAYAREQADRRQLTIDYIDANYLDVDLGKQFDLIIMIMCDYCALSPKQRRTLLRQFTRYLKPGGQVLLDVYSMNGFAAKTEQATHDFNLLDGFFSPDPYFGFVNTFKYPDERVILDKYTIIQSLSSREFYNWLQYYDTDQLAAEFAEGGFRIGELLGNVAGDPFDAEATEFAIIASVSE